MGECVERDPHPLVEWVKKMVMLEGIFLSTLRVSGSAASGGGPGHAKSGVEERF